MRSNKSQPLPGPKPGVIVVPLLVLQDHGGIHATRWQGRVLRRYQMRQVMMGVGLFTHDTSLPVGQTAPGRKFPGALALPSDCDEARRYARASRSPQPGTFWAIQRARDAVMDVS
ncbi:hypothetical protein FAGAP_13383 [Fusarium agapanthi]|uniref:Uncharacterized protein n=1 Tax=Fusarium agapanthi TaxID=1803897 RepID=A0A9P5E2B8_9HYPO|nr:hypothetical protein FAGAP_13383 [Fusarium agapanthi]